GTLSRFVNGLREYNNSLAGKTTRLDRFVVDTAGKGVLDTLGVLQGLRGRSSILGNVGSAIVQVSALPQAYGVANPKNFMLAALEQAKAAVKDDPHDPMLQSRFMNIRYSDVKNNFRTKFSKAQDILGSPLEMVEKASTEIVWRSMYNKALSTGLKGDAAILEADRLTSRTAGSRNFGDKSELMRTKALGPVTQFKLEVFNTAQQIASRGGELNPLHHPVRFLNFAIAAAALGAGLQVVLGRDPIIDPLHALAQAGKGLFGKDPNNEYGSGAIAPVNVALDQVLNNVPFGPEIAQGLNLKKSADGSNDFLKGTDFDKFGYSNTVSSLAQQLINAASKHDAASTEKLAASFVPAGGQILKGVQGVQTVNKGVTDSDGVVTTEVPKNPLNYAKSVLFGKNSIPEVQQSYDASNGGIASSGKLGDALRLNTKQEKQLQVQFKKSLTPEQNDLRKLSADERATLVNEGAVTTDQLADVDRKVLAAKKQLGIVPGVGGQTVPKLPGNTPQTVKDFYKERAYIYDGDLKDWQGKKAQGNAKALIDTANQIVPEGAPAIPQTNQVAELYADFAKRRADAKWGAEKENVEKGKFLSQIYKSTLSSQQQEWYGLSDTNLQTAIDNGEITAPDLDGLVSFDDQMRKFGLPGGIGNTLRKDYGYQEWSAPGAKPKNGKKFSLPASYFNNAATVGSFRKLITNAKLKGGK
ncbi:MAG TPA: hypothetical protein VLH38_03275, partial [Patescibacteria group bacterium]|nr:hypothetical protein [Patescibacteria group bacterium]